MPDRRCTMTSRLKVFTANAVDRLWLTDITEHPTAESKLYLCAVKDVFSGRIVDYSIDSRMTASLAVSALRNAVGPREPAGTIVHSDRGNQFRSRKFVNALHRNGLPGSMGRVGACGDNAAIESFFTLLQNNVLDRQRWHSREELRLAIVTWIEHTYHRQHRQIHPGKLTPIKFETTNRPQPRPEPPNQQVNRTRGSPELEELVEAFALGWLGAEPAAGVVASQEWS